MNLWTYLLLLLKASLFSSSGTGNLPSLHADLIPRGWATQTDFAEALAVGQISPGPSGLWVISLGYLTAGLKGSLLALVAVVLPPLLVVGIERLYRSVQHHAAVEGFVRGLGLAVVGIFVMVMLRLLHANGIGVRSVAIAIVTIGLGATQRVPILVILFLATGAGILFR